MRQIIENRYSESPLRETAIATLDVVYQDHRQEIIADMNYVICEKQIRLLIIQYLWRNPFFFLEMAQAVYKKTIDYYQSHVLKETVGAQFCMIYTMYRDQMIFRMNGIMNSKEVDCLIICFLWMHYSKYVFLLIIWNAYSVTLLFYLKKKKQILHYLVCYCWSLLIWQQ